MSSGNRFHVSSVHQSPNKGDLRLQLTTEDLQNKRWFKLFKKKKIIPIILLEKTRKMAEFFI